MGLLEPTHLIMILLVVLIIFGGTKIPQLMRGIGQGMGEFQKGLNESKKIMKDSMDVNKELEAESESSSSHSGSASPRANAPKEL